MAIKEKKVITGKPKLLHTAALTALLATLLCVSMTRAQSGAESTFKTKCAGCHGADGSSNTAAGKAMGVRPFQSAEVQKESEADLEEVIAKGKSKMPKYADKLKDSEIKELAAYCRQLSAKK